MKYRLLFSAKMHSAYRARQLLAWALAAYQEFLSKDEADTFPCAFGIVAHRKGDLRDARIAAPMLQ